MAIFAEVTKNERIIDRHLRGIHPFLEPPKLVKSVKKCKIMAITLFIYLQTIISFCHNTRIWQTDRQTDRQKVNRNTVRMLRSRTVKSNKLDDDDDDLHSISSTVL